MLNELEKTRLKNWCEKFFINADSDSMVFDLYSYVDNNLTYEENKTQLRIKIKQLLPNYSEKEIEKMKRKDVEISKGEYEQLLTNQIQRAEKQAELELDKALKKIEETPTTNTIEELYFIPKSYAKMVARGNARGLILYGETGIGKSFLTKRAFIEEDKKFVYISGHITQLELYTYLLEHKDENIILDDVNVLNNEINLNMFKSALSESGVVQYHTSSPRLRVPSSFVFKGTICLLLNQKPSSNENLRAVESRIINYELNFTYAEKMMIICDLAKQNYKNISQVEKNDIIKWIRENTSKATDNFSLRTLFMLYEFYLFDKVNWKRLVEKIIVKDEEKDLIVKGMACREWCESTGKSRATYFRLKAKL